MSMVKVHDILERNCLFESQNYAQWICNSDKCGENFLFSISMTVAAIVGEL